LFDSFSALVLVHVVKLARHCSATISTAGGCRARTGCRAAEVPEGVTTWSAGPGSRRGR
jgi:hypothetical protein